ncbi:unnamed protein product [Rotaria sp. Silwood2]|nr:unnamed protein product [Rotaria sp. Silwood2]
MLHEQFTSNNNRKQKAKSNSDEFFNILGKVNKFLEYTFSLPMKIYDDFVSNIYDLITNNLESCAMCTCITITATVSVTCIAVGVGIGTGIGCFR